MENPTTTFNSSGDKWTSDHNSSSNDNQASLASPIPAASLLKTQLECDALHNPNGVVVPLPAMPAAVVSTVASTDSVPSATVFSTTLPLSALSSNLVAPLHSPVADSEMALPPAAGSVEVAVISTTTDTTTTNVAHQVISSPGSQVVASSSSVSSSSDASLSQLLPHPTNIPNDSFNCSNHHQNHHNHPNNNIVDASINPVKCNSIADKQPNNRLLQQGHQPQSLPQPPLPSSRLVDIPIGSESQHNCPDSCFGLSSAASSQLARTVVVDSDYRRPRTLTIGSSSISSLTNSSSSSSSSSSVSSPSPCSVSSSCSLSLSSNQSSNEMKPITAENVGAGNGAVTGSDISLASFVHEHRSPHNHRDIGSQSSSSSSTLATTAELSNVSGVTASALAAAAVPATKSSKLLTNDDTSTENIPIFSELSQLCRIRQRKSDGGDSTPGASSSELLAWKEIARWVKYEENVEQNGTRWSKPYVSAVNLSAFLELKNSIQHGVVLFDSYSSTFEQLVDEFLELILVKNLLMVTNDPNGNTTPEAAQIESVAAARIGQLLLLPKRHQFEMKSSLIRSLSDLRTPMTNQSSSSSLSTAANYPKLGSSNAGATTTATTTTTTSSSSLSSLSRFNEEKPLSLQQTISSNDLDKSSSKYVLSTKHNLSDNGSNSNDVQHSSKHSPKYNRAFRKKLSPDTVSNSILIGEVDFLAYPVSGLIRLKNATKFDSFNELSIPTKFVYIYLGPSVKNSPAASTDYWQIGRAYATLMSDKIFASIASKTQSIDSLLLAIDEFISQAPILPPNIWDPETRIEPPEKLPTANYSQKHCEQQQQYQQHLLLMAAHDDNQFRLTQQQGQPESQPQAQPNYQHQPAPPHSQSYCNKAYEEYEPVPPPPAPLDQYSVSQHQSPAFLLSEGTIPSSQSISTVSTLPVSAQSHQHHLHPDHHNSHQLHPYLCHYDSTTFNGDNNNSPYYFDKEIQLSSDEEEEIERQNNGLTRTGRLFGGLANDIGRKLPHYWTDITDAFALQSIASIVFLYFACLAPIITFGGMLGDATGNNIATMESLVCGALCGIVYALFSGQPLTILGSTGPVLVFETIVYDFCQSNGYNYLSLRFWIGMWTTLILFLFVAFDASFFVCYITRFTEENFASLISVIFIYNAIEKLLNIGEQYPVNWHSDQKPDYNCSCFDRNQSRTTVLQSDRPNPTAIAQCLSGGNIVVGRGCQTPEYIPNVYLFSILLFLFTTLISVKLKHFRNSRFFDTKVRQFIGDFAVPIAITAMTLFDYLVGIATPKLHVPTDFKPTLSSRNWLVSPLVPENPVWLSVVAVFPALLATILIFMDQQITAVIVNRKEHKLKKGCGYHLDLFVLSILIGICSLFGLPWFVAATVLSITHVNSLKMLSESAAPGEKPQFFGVREQRVTNATIFVLCGLSIFFTTILQKIPMPVLYGVFLFMGMSSLDGSQFIDRILIVFMPQKYQPDHTFLRRVSINRIHLFTLIQILCFVFLWIVKSYKAISIAFPLMLLVILSVRKLLDFVFSQEELKILDDKMPESKRRKQKRKQAKQSPTGLAMAGRWRAGESQFVDLKLQNEFKLKEKNREDRFS